MSDRISSEVTIPSSESSDHGSESKHLIAGLAQSPRKKRVGLIVGCAIVVVLGLALGLGLGLSLQRPSINYDHKGPNVIVVMTDDQDLQLDSMSVMPKVKSLIGDHGVTYNKHYCTVSICCPSRVNVLTGKAAHNTNVTALKPPYGGWGKFTEEGLNENYLPVWIQAAGIRTYYVGKFLNSFGRKNWRTPKPPQGWTDSSFLVDPGTYDYMHSIWTNGHSSGSTRFNDIHTTIVTQTKALAFLDDAASSKDQFFLMVAPVAPHNAGGGNPPCPPGYEDTFTNRTAPRSENFNPDVPSGASWVRKLPKLNERQIQYCDGNYWHRLCNVAGIDDMVAQLIHKLDEYGILNNTYILFTSDNGYHIGNHRLIPGKRLPYEEDVNVPLLLRGPDVAEGLQSNLTHSHTDIAPTVLQMLGMPMRPDFDGEPMAYREKDLVSSTKQELVNIEFWNMADQKPSHYRGKHVYANNTYKALRMMDSNSSSMFYSAWCNGEHEFYDMATDPYQMNNWLGPDPIGNASEYYGRPQSELVARLDALLMVTKNCKQDTCRRPWNVMFPKGQVSNMQDAMSPVYDSFFANQPKISFNGCPDGHILADEGPLHVNTFTG